MKNVFLSVIAIISITFSAKAQTYDGFESFLLATESDAKALVSGYLSPAIKGMNHSLNGGWYHTAKTHKKFGFDITISANLSFAPSKDELFSIAGLNNVSTLSGETSIPTVLGDNRNETLVIKVPNYEDVEVTAPGGIKDDLPLKGVPAPMVQVGFGLPLETDVIIRYLPTVDSEGVQASLFGLGFKHNLLQYFGPIDKLPLNVSVLAAYSKMSTRYDLQSTSSIPGADQEISFSTNTLTVQALASLDLLFIDFYAGLGYGLGKTSFDVLGTYNLEYTDASTNMSTSKEIIDPIAMNVKSSGVKATIGTRINIAFFKIFADYSFQEYNTFTAGVAFSIR
jgi:hypothetical protein